MLPSLLVLLDRGKDIAMDIVRAVHYLDTIKVLHFDIKVTARTFAFKLPKAGHEAQAMQMWR